MFEFYKSSEEEYDKVYELNNKIIRHLIKEDILKMADFKNYSFPYSREQIIPKIEEMAGDAKLLTDSISKILNIESFLTSDIHSISNDTFYGYDFIVLNDTYFTTNPLSEYVKKIENNIKSKKENELLFSKIGFISTFELQRIKNDIENNTLNKDSNNKISYLKIEYFLDKLIIKAINKEAEGLRMTYKNGMIKIGYNIEFQFQEEDLLFCSIEEYNKISKYIISLFDDTTILKNFKTNKYKLKLRINKGTEKSEIIDVLDLKISNLKKDFPKLENVDLPIFDKKEFEKKLELPFGLLVVSSNNNIKENIYSVIEQQRLAKPSQKIYTIEDYIETTMPEIVQFEKNTQVSWKDLNLFDYQIIAVDDIKDKEEFNVLLNAVSRGKFVILGVNANSAIEGFAKLHHYTENYEQLADNLLGIIHIDKVQRVCQLCSTEEEFIKSNRYQNFSMFENAPKMNTLIKTENDKGCDNCHNGFKGMEYVVEYLNNDEVLKDSILNGCNLKKLRIEKSSNSWENIFESSAKLLSEGKTSANAIIAALGEPRKS